MLTPRYHEWHLLCRSACRQRKASRVSPLQDGLRGDIHGMHRLLDVSDLPGYHDAPRHHFKSLDTKIYDGFLADMLSDIWPGSIIITT